ncbi:hypothetical protein CYMTET_35632 [Cymbomonas tetramitiformis]|uniref:Uncharacterized protein n=1 Tax=Cymbomonas tetramitiformis TaxID=36881 RepID=A0AAE0F8R4_9CHLO|nr:hypothetical protein CYMTET_35632 [Cymbomonas tetramitiformis]
MSQDAGFAGSGASKLHWTIHTWPDARQADADWPIFYTTNCTKESAVTFETYESKLKERYEKNEFDFDKLKQVSEMFVLIAKVDDKVAKKLVWSFCDEYGTCPLIEALCIKNLAVSTLLVYSSDERNLILKFQHSNDTDWKMIKAYRLHLKASLVRRGMPTEHAPYDYVHINIMDLDEKIRQQIAAIERLKLLTDDRFRQAHENTQRVYDMVSECQATLDAYHKSNENLDAVVLNLKASTKEKLKQFKANQTKMSVEIASDYEQMQNQVTSITNQHVTLVAQVNKFENALENSISQFQANQDDMSLTSASEYLSMQNWITSITNQYESIKSTLWSLGISPTDSPRRFDSRIIKRLSLTQKKLDRLNEQFFEQE